jgi:TatD DNase family protein
MQEPLLYDSHTHLYDERFDSDRDEVLKRCSEKMRGWINVGSDLKTTKSSIELATRFPQSSASSGVHPHDAKQHSLAELDEVLSLYSHSSVVAAGEMGLDYYYDNSPREIQSQVFKKQLEAAKEAGMPCIIHVRDAFDDFFEIVDEVNYYQGVVHCFSGGVAEAMEALRRGFHLGYGGLLTFKNAQITREAFLATPIDRVLLETDCPYLTPHPQRGKRNEPIFVSYVATKMSELTQHSEIEILNQTYKNAKALFNLF